MPGNIDGFLASTPKGKRKDLPDLTRGGIRLEPGEIDNLLDDAAGAGKKLTAGVRHAAATLEQLAGMGLTFDTFVALVHMHCDPPARGGHPPSREIVAAVLRGMFRFEEHLR